MKKPRKPTPAMPRTPAEWQFAVDAAYFYLWLDSARQYGLVTGGPGVNVDRCAEILAERRKRGIKPSPNTIERFLERQEA